MIRKKQNTTKPDTGILQFIEGLHILFCGENIRNGWAHT